MQINEKQTVCEQLRILYGISSRPCMVQDRVTVIMQSFNIASDRGGLYVDV